MPLQAVVPMLLVLDLVATTLVGLRNWQSVSRAELMRLLPCMVVGVALGTTVLARVDSRWPGGARRVLLAMTARAWMAVSSQAAPAPAACRCYAGAC